MHEVPEILCIGQTIEGSIPSHSKMFHQGCLIVRFHIFEEVTESRQRVRNVVDPTPKTIAISPLILDVVNLEKKILL
jgi:hypothetical protein